MKTTLITHDLLGEEPAHDPSAALGTLAAACTRLEQLSRFSVAGSSRQYHRAVSVIHEICDALADCEAAGVPDDELRRSVQRAREIHGLSPFVTRLQQWPRGYPGDFQTIEWLWLGQNRAPAGTLAHAIETYALTAAIAQQHRNKVNFQSACLLQAMAAARPCRVLSIGCGGSPDLRTVLDHVPSSATFVLCDSDEEALEFSRTQLPSIGEQCRFVQGMVPRVLRRVRSEGPFNLILAGGLFDYLSDRFIVRTLNECWHLLAPNGRIVFTNIGRGNPFRLWLEYLADWRLIERDEEDIVRLCRDAEISERPVVVRDATALALIATVRKAASKP